MVNPRIASMYSIRFVAIMATKLQKKAGTFGELNRKCYFCRMKERINWIDWAKALAVTTVVFCHLPQSQEWYYYRFLQACIISVLATHCWATMVHSSYFVCPVSLC